MLDQKDIAEYGGKGAILNHIREKCPDLPIHEYSYDSSDFARLNKPVIVRSSSPYEYEDFEGIFESVPDVTSQQGLENAIRDVKQSAMSKRALTYAEQNGFTIDDQMRVIIQEQVKSPYIGAMMRLPNNPDVIVINHRLGKERQAFCFYSESKKELISELGGIPCIGVKLDEALMLVDAYKQIEGLTDIAEGYSLYVEFGLNPFAIFQARPFKKIQTADFELPPVPDGAYYLRTDLCLGITPEDGIQLPMVRNLSTMDAVAIAADLQHSRPEELDFKFSGLEISLRMGLKNEAMLGAHVIDTIRYNLMKRLKGHNLGSDKPEGYCFMISSAIREEYDVDLSVPHMQAFVHGESYVFLVHDIIRLLKKARVSLLRDDLMFNDFFLNVGTGSKARIVSNGKEAVIFQE